MHYRFVNPLDFTFYVFGRKYTHPDLTGKPMHTVVVLFPKGQDDAETVDFYIQPNDDPQPQDILVARKVKSYGYTQRIA